MVGEILLPIAGQATQDTRSNAQKRCEGRGGTWDEATQTCSIEEPTAPEPAPEQAPVVPTTPETFRDQGGDLSGIRLADGRIFTGLNPDEVRQIADAEARKAAQPEDTVQAGTAATAQRQLEAGQQLQGQVGQFDPLAIDPTGLDVGEAAISGVVGSIPTAIRTAGQFGAAAAAAGAIGGSVVPGAGTAVGAGAGAIIGASVGFVAGIASGMTSSFKGQRSDTTTAQQRVLDEGKQTMKDWATLAENDPSNKAQYLTEFNKVSAQIDQAYRQMKLDTSRDVAKFETALPNLAEFEAFYSSGGERDALNIEMRNSLIAVAPENYNMLELSQRRGALAK